MTDQSRARKTFTNPLYFLALGFGSGLSRWMPGTAGTVMAVPVYWLFQPLGLWWHLGIIGVSLVAGIYLCDWVARDMKIKDPGCIVWDEFVGLWITLILCPVGWYWLLLGFLLFRLFDILKPWPVSWLDRNLAGGLGIMLDDVAAGVYALICLQLAYCGANALGWG
ncbi:MAG: phosphatidylglycerophosphatase A [Planctomycetaceae bacterium]|jgi:phosphatidylglycerophosphatase A